MDTEHCTPYDYGAQLAIAQELHATYAQLLFPGERLQEYWFLANHLNDTLYALVTTVRAIQHECQR
jgi:hypothetical protein